MYAVRTFISHQGGGQRQPGWYRPPAKRRYRPNDAAQGTKLDRLLRRRHRIAAAVRFSGSGLDAVAEYNVSDGKVSSELGFSNLLLSYCEIGERLGRGDYLLQ